MNSKLFKKLNEQIELNQIKNVEITESDKKIAEEKIIFGDTLKQIQENVEMVDTNFLTEELLLNLLNETTYLVPKDIDEKMTNIEKKISKLSRKIEIAKKFKLPHIYAKLADSHNKYVNQYKELEKQAIVKIDVLDEIKFVLKDIFKESIPMLFPKYKNKKINVAVNSLRSEFIGNIRNSDNLVSYGILSIDGEKHSYQIRGGSIDILTIEPKKFEIMLDSMSGVFPKRNSDEILVESFQFTIDYSK